MGIEDMNDNLFSYPLFLVRLSPNFVENSEKKNPVCMHTLAHLLHILSALLGYNWHTKILYIFNVHNLINLDICMHS